MDEIVELVEDIPYKNLLRTPDAYIGKYVLLHVKVSQVLNSGVLNKTTYYFGKTRSGSGGFYGDEYGFLDYRIDDDLKILEDDVLTVYGRFSGLQTFERALTSVDAEIPIIEMLYIDIQGVTETHAAASK